MSLGYQHGQILVRSLFNLQTANFSLHPHKAERRAQEAGSPVTLPKALIPIQEDFTPKTLSNPKHLPKAPPPNAITLRQ